MKDKYTYYLALLGIIVAQLSEDKQKFLKSKLQEISSAAKKR